MDDSPATVPLEFVRALVVQARQLGHDVAAILERAQFPFDPLAVEVAPISVSPTDYNRLCLALFEALGDESGGIIRGVPTPVGTTRMLLMSVLHCKTLQQVLERAIEFNGALREAGVQPARHALQIHGDRVQLQYHPQLPSSEQAAVLCSMAIWLRVCGWLIGRDVDILHAGIAGPLPPQRAGIKHFFHCPVAQNQPCNWIAFPASYLSAAPRRSEADLRQFLAEAAYRTVIEPPAAEGPMGVRLRALLEPLPLMGWPHFEQLALDLRIAPRTLRRRLAAEGDSFQRLRDRIRRDRAVRDLRAGISVERAAERAGFNDSSAFHRAFRRWTGLSPGQFR